MPLDTKVRIKLGKMTKLTIFLLLATLGFSSGSAPKCDKRPLGQQSHKTYGDNGFKVTPFVVVLHVNIVCLPGVSGGLPPAVQAWSGLHCHPLWREDG